MSRRMVIALLVLTLSSCAGVGSDHPAGVPSSTDADPTEPTATTAVTGPDWAAPGLQFLAALGRSARAGEDETMLAFYHSDARLVAPGSGIVATGWRQISTALDHLPGAVDPALTMIGQVFAATLSVGGPDCDREGCTQPWVDVYQIHDGAIGLQFHASGAGLSTTDPLHALYVDSAVAYSAHDIDGLRPFYSDAVFAPPFPEEEFEALFEALPDLTAEPVTLDELGVGTSGAPALFDLGVIGASSTHSRGALGVYRTTLSPGVETVAATIWSLWDDRIVESTTVFDPFGWDRLLEELDVEPPEGWYSDIRIPVPRTVERTHVIEVADGSVIELFDASDRAAQLVEWSVGRFDLAGLPSPHVSAVYMESARSCLEESGWTSVGETGSIIRICLSEADLGAGDDLSLAGQVTMLHELAHVWTAENLSDEVASAFMTTRGLATWNDASASWSDRGNEQASEIIAWGLAVEPIDLVRLGESDCDVMESSFRLLTGADPLHGC